ncbi:hypothetical protein D3C87_1257680 [compost metagenome]
MDTRADALLAQRLHHVAACLRRAAAQAVRGQYHLEHVPVGGGADGVQRQRQLDAKLGQPRVCGAAEVGLGQRGALGGDGGELRQLRQPDGSVDVGQVELAARLLHVHAVHARADHALQAQALGAQGFLGRVQHQAAAFDGGDVLVRLEAEAGQVAKGADALAAPAGIDGLGGILDHAQLVLAGDGVEPVHVHGQAGQVDRHDGPRARRDGGLHGVQVEVAGARVDIDEHRAGAHGEHHVGRGHPGDRRGDDFVARADIGHAQGDLHRGRAVGERPHRPAAEHVGQRRFKRLHLRAGSDPSGGKHLADLGNGLGVDLGPHERQEGLGCGNGHGS